MENRSTPHPLNAVPALIACVAIAFGTLAAERKLQPGDAAASSERREQPLLAPAGLAPTIHGEKR